MFYGTNPLCQWQELRIANPLHLPDSFSNEAIGCSEIIRIIAVKESGEELWGMKQEHSHHNPHCCHHHPNKHQQYHTNIMLYALILHKCLTTKYTVLTASTRVHYTNHSRRQPFVSIATGLEGQTTTCLQSLHRYVFVMWLWHRRSVQVAAVANVPCSVRKPLYWVGATETECMCLSTQCTQPSEPSSPIQHTSSLCFSIFSCTLGLLPCVGGRRW